MVIDNDELSLKCPFDECNNNEGGYCGLHFIVFENGMCTNNTKNDEYSGVELRLFNHNNNKVTYRGLSNKELLQIEKIFNRGGKDVWMD